MTMENRKLFTETIHNRLAAGKALAEEISQLLCIADSLGIKFRNSYSSEEIILPNSIEFGNGDLWFTLNTDE